MQLASGGQQFVAKTMYARGVSFLGAAVLLERQGGFEWVVLHLICQGAEVLLKSFLLFADYDRYQPRLKKNYGHDLAKLARSVLSEYGLNPMKPALSQELHDLNQFYKQHRLRYANAGDLFLDPNTIGRDRVFRRLVAALQIAAPELAQLD